jgi:hypothetical protein
MGQIVVEVLRPADDGVATVTATLVDGKWTCMDDKFLMVLNSMHLPTGYYPDLELAQAMSVTRYYGGKITDTRSITVHSGDVEVVA